MNTRLVAAAIALSLLPSVASAQSLRASVAPTVQQTVTDWQKQYDASLAQKARGKRNMLIAAGASIGGLLLITTSAKNCVITTTTKLDDCTGMSALQKVGWLASVGSSGVFVWGMVDFFDGNGEMNRLEMHRPTGKDAAVLTLNAHQTIALGGGTQKTVSYRVSW